MAADHDVVKHRKIEAQARALKRARYARPVNLLRRKTCDVLPVEHDLARAWVVDARHNVEKRCFARSVGAHKAHDFVAVHVDIQGLKRHKPAKAHGQPRAFKKMGAHYAMPPV